MEAETDAWLVRLGTLLREAGYSFVTPTPATHARVNARADADYAYDLRGVFGWSRPFDRGIVPSSMLELLNEAAMVQADGAAWRSLVRVSTLDDLLFFHSAFPTTAADAVFFGPDTYRFARAIQAHMPQGVVRAADIGCGAGPGAILIAKAHPEAEVLAVDINEAALRLMRVNAALAQVRVTALNSDLLSRTGGVFDLIVANPPYLVDPGERAYRHGGGPLGAGMSLAILDAACGRLAPGGTLLLYTGAAIVNGTDPFRDAAIARLARSGLDWTYEEIDPDVFGEELADGPYAVADRIAAVLLTVTRPGV